MNLDKIKSIVITDKDGNKVFELDEKRYTCYEGYEMKVTSKLIDAKTFEVFETDKCVDEDLKQRNKDMESYNNNPDYRGQSPFGRFRR